MKPKVGQKPKVKIALADRRPKRRQSKSRAYRTPGAGLTNNAHDAAWQPHGHGGWGGAYGAHNAT